MTGHGGGGRILTCLSAPPPHRGLSPSRALRLQEMVYRATTKGLIEGVISGYNATVFAYGPTGKGRPTLGTLARRGQGREPHGAGSHPRLWPRRQRFSLATGVAGGQGLGGTQGLRAPSSGTKESAQSHKGEGAA